MAPPTRVRAATFDGNDAANSTDYLHAALTWT
jgi:hypothetical protein